jgi:transcriptional/translational regulatory protein YebC/TACO1
LEAGGEDLCDDGESYEIFFVLGVYPKVREVLGGRGIPIAMGEVAMIPKNRVRVEGKKAQNLLSMMEALEDHDDVQHAYANFDIPDEELDRRAS